MRNQKKANEIQKKANEIQKSIFIYINIGLGTSRLHLIKSPCLSWYSFQKDDKLFKKRRQTRFL